jgi:hypothetical protein
MPRFNSRSCLKPDFEVSASSTKLIDGGLRSRFVGPASIMVCRLDERVDLPDFVPRQAQAEGWHLRSLATLDHRLKKALVAELRREEVRPPRAGAVVVDVALAGASDPAGGDGVASSAL